MKKTFLLSHLLIKAFFIRSFNQSGLLWLEDGINKKFLIVCFLWSCEWHLFMLSTIFVVISVATPNVRFTMNGMYLKNNTPIYKWHEQVIKEWSCWLISIVVCSHSVKLYALTTWLSDCNKIVLWPGCEGHAMCNLHKKVRPVCQCMDYADLVYANN